MTVTVLGAALRQIIPKMVGQNITNWFELCKPLVEFKWEVCPMFFLVFLGYLNNLMIFFYCAGHINALNLTIFILSLLSKNAFLNRNNQLKIFLVEKLDFSEKNNKIIYKIRPAKMKPLCI